MNAARIVFGVSAVVFGIAALLNHDSDLWQHLPPVGAVAGTFIAWVLTIAQVAGGLGILYARTRLVALVALLSVYLLFVLGCVPGIAHAPGDYGSYVDLFELLSVVCGVLAISADTGPDLARSARTGRAARIGLGVCTVSFALAQVVYFQYTASLVPTWIPPSQSFWTVLTTVAFMVAAFAILTNLQARLAIRLMALMTGLFGVFIWVPHIVAAPATLSNWTEIAENYLITAAALLVADLKAF